MDVFLVLENFFLQTTTFEIILNLFTIGGWVIFVAVLFSVGFPILASYRSSLYTKDWKWVLLAIDMPQENVQTPKAVEQLFSHIFSVLEIPEIKTKYWTGFQQNKFSFEIISIAGYIQFLVYTRDIHRDLIEAAVYAQYPDVEITEVEDYTNNIPDTYPSETYNMWATDFSLAEHYAYPIRMYSEFEHSISKDTVIKDSMGTFLESFSRIGPGEQVWFQIIVEPREDKRWKDECIKKIKELIGEKVPQKKSMLSFITDNPVTKEFGKSMQEFNAQLAGGLRSDGVDSISSDDGQINNISFLTPGQKDLVEKMEQKISKLGFLTKLRGVYVARNEVFNPDRAIHLLIGAINQYNIPTSNSLIQSYTASDRKNGRKNIHIKAYKDRNSYAGGKEPYVLNIEELATIWHFPMSHVKTPNVQKAINKSAQPPIGLPMEVIANIPQTEKNKNSVHQKPSHMTDSGDVIHFDDFG